MVSCSRHSKGSVTLIKNATNVRNAKDLMVPACLMGGTYIAIPPKGNIDKMAYFPFKYTETKDLKRHPKTKTFELESSLMPINRSVSPLSIISNYSFLETLWQLPQGKITLT